MRIYMNKIILLFILITFFIQGCVGLPSVPSVRPLTERFLGGKGRDKILVIDISGMISDKEKGDILGIGLSKKPRITARIREELDMATEDKRIKAVILRINTPGGDVTTCDIIHHELESFKEKTDMPIVAQFMGIAASGGYYIAASADKLVAHPTTVTGGVGVVAYRVNASGLMDKIGISNETIKSGEKKDLGSPLRSMTDEEREILQGIIDGMFVRFMNVVREARPGIEDEAIGEIADGRVFTAERALEIKLIDRIGYMDDAIEIAKEEAGIEEARIVTYARPASYRANIYSRSDLDAPPSINLFNIDVKGISRFFNLSFMYLWVP
jgi:protease-4